MGGGHMGGHMGGAHGGPPIVAPAPTMPMQPQAMVNNQLTRQARRLYVGGIPLGAQEVCDALYF